jgi:DNA-binding MarR family transcriptional regulator
MLLSEFRALQFLEQGPATLGQVSRALGLSPATLTTLAGGLERRRWVGRQRSASDGRAFILEAKAAGLRALHESRRDYGTRLKALQQGLPPSSRQSLHEGLSDLRTRLESTRKRAAVSPGRE